jgi:phosphoglycerol transferase MdoB-like AlkP superfamily enzyme
MMKIARKSLSAVFCFLFIYFLSWHLALVAASPKGLLKELKFFLMIKGFEYALASAVITALLFAACFLAKERKTMLRAVFLAAVFLFIADGAIRILDWGVIFFAGQHVDNEFWFQAFYSDGTSFLLTVPAGFLLFSWALVTVFFVFILRRISHSAVNFQGEKLYPVIKANAVLSGVFFLVVMIPLLTLTRADSGKQFYSELPEQKVISSFFDYTFGGNVGGALKRTVLKKETIEKLKQCGVIVNPANERYPLLKKSIYLDPKNKSDNKPVIHIGQNIIVIFLESMSQFLMQEEIHGYKGLTPNLHAMLSESYEFTSMYNSNYPTVKGTIATLSSDLFVVDKIKGLGDGFRTPVPCNFLFLSNVLAPYGYTAVHVQGGSGIFGGMKELFENKQKYNKFYGFESVELHAYAKNKSKSDWGLRDEDIFRYAVKLMDENDNKKPFLLTLSTIDVHPPYDALYTSPASRGIKLLNCLYSTDKGVGVFWDYFKKSRYYNNTVVVVIADHAMGGGVDYDSFLGKFKKDSHSFCDFITCFIYLPGNDKWKGKKNSTFCTNLDMLPTLLDMMNIDCENPFLGLSIFSDRLKYPYPISHFNLEAHPYLSARMDKKGRELENKVKWNEADQTEFYNFMGNLAVTRRFYPPISK